MPADPSPKELLMTEENAPVTFDVPEGERAFRALEIAEHHYPMAGRRQVVAAHFGVAVDNPGLLPLIALCAEYNLSPTAGLVHLLPHRVRIPGPGGVETWVERWSPAIGRDGLLHLARRTLGKPYGYRGHRVVTICANDRIEASFRSDAMAEPVVRHRMAPKPARFREGEDPALWRGEVVGAWAVAYFDQLPTAFYHANIREYGRRERAIAEDGTELDEVQWAGAWVFTSAMAEKCGESRVVRQGLGVTGFVPVDELRDLGAWQRGDYSMGIFADDAERGPMFEFESIEDEALREELRKEVDRANTLEPFSWAPAKLAMFLRDSSKDEQEAVLARLRIENEHREQRRAGKPRPRPRRRARRARRRRGARRS